MVSQAQPAAYVLRQDPNGAGAAVWEAVVLSRPISTAIVAHHVPLAQTKRAVEQEVTE